MYLPPAVSLLLAAFLLIPQGGTLFGYGNTGHQTVGALAAHYLEGTPAATKVRKLLRPPKEDLAQATTWADRAKFPEKYLSDEMKEYVANNPDHHSFHYCDVPFQEAVYRAGTTGTNPADIVHMMKLCIEILKNPEPKPENPRHLTKRQALLLLAHLMGDLHQPLHVGCSYVDANDHFVNPNTGAKGQEDAGGNHFKLTSSLSLHGFWDTPAVKLAKDKVPPGEDFVSYLLRKDPPQLTWKAKGPVETWPGQWANESLRLAGQCFRGLTLSNRRTIAADEKHPAPHDEWKVTLPPGYDEMAAKLVEVEIAKAGWRLAQVLQAIWP